MVPDAIEMETRTRSPSNEPRTEDDGDEEREGLLDGGLKPTDGEDLPVGLERWKIITSFFVFGLINNVLYVIILSAALDLVSSTTPKGVVLFFNIAPSLMAKVGWPFLLKGQIHYYRRIFTCASCSFIGMLIIAFSPSLPPRLLGISLASFSSGLGELTFLQLSSLYPSYLSLGGFASGTGGAGILGAGLWVAIKGWGVKKAMGATSILPIGMVAMLLLVLKPRSTKSASTSTVKSSGLSASEKWALARPLIVKFMLPLFAVYVFEYTINQGVAPTLLYDLPVGGLLGWFVKGPRDFYPLYQLTYQTFVFISRSSHLLGLPSLHPALLPIPSILQAFNFLFALHESLAAPASRFGLHAMVAIVCLEGLCGGTAYVQTFHHVRSLGEDDEVDEERKQEEREWRIGVVGASDSWGVLIASLVSMPLELVLCQAQVDSGRDLCRTL